MTDMREENREQSGSFDLVVRAVDEAERRMIKLMRPDIERMSSALERVSLDVHDLKVRREVDTTVATVARLDDRLSNIERWRAYVTGAVAVLTALALTFGVLAYQRLDEVSRDVSAIKAGK
jgi:hypothetical protein